MNYTQALDEEDLKKVFEEVLDLKSKYYSFGRSLGLKGSTLDAIRVNNPCNCEQALNDVLLHWLKQQFNVQKFGTPTWKRLVEAVRDSAGGECPRLARDIAAKHPDREHCKVINEHLESSLQFDPVGRTIDKHIEELMLNVNNPVRLAERLCLDGLIPQTVLEDVRDSDVYKPYQGMAILFKSSIARKEMSSNPHLFEKFLKILLDVIPAGIEKIVKHMRSTFEQELRQCNQKEKNILPVNDRPFSSIKCRPISKPSMHNDNDIIISECVSYLKLYYQRHVRAIKFPHKAPVKYINLALIRREHLTRSQTNNITSSTIHGNIDDILDATCKSPFTIEEVGQPSKDNSFPSFILVMGAPGVGKSTFAQKLALGWSEGTLLQAYTMVLLLRARDSDVQEATELSQLLYPKSLQNNTARELSRNYGDGVLFIIDGYDELPSCKRNFLDSLIRGELLPAATVMVTTRSSARDHILRQCPLSSTSQFIEILGFTKKDVESYAESEMANNLKMLQEFKSYLSCYPYIYSAMYIPLNCAFVVKIYIETWSEDEEIIVPKTLTELYTALIRGHLIRHVMSKDSKLSSLTNIESLPSYEKFILLAKFAHDNLLNNKVVFAEDDIPTVTGFETFSLMQEEPELYIDKGYRKSYNFIHFTIQEYLAAFFVSKQDSEHQLKFLDSHKGNKTLSVVMKFLSGLTRFKQLDSLCLQNIIAPRDEKEQSVSVDTLHMLFEAHSEETTRQILCGKSVTFRHLAFPSLTPYDYYVLGYCISCTSNVLWDVFLWSELSDESKRLFTIGVGNSSTNGGISHLWMQGCNLGTSKLEPFFKCPLLIHLVSLTLQETNLEVNACGILSECFALFPFLVHLNLDRNPMLFKQGGAKKFFDSLLINNTISDLLLENTALGDGGAVAHFLKFCKSLAILDVDDNLLTFEGTQLILEALQINKTVKYIGLSGSNISRDNSILVGHVLRCNYLQKLYVNRCQIDSNGVEHIAEALIKNQSLFLLHLSKNQIGEAGALSLAKMIAKNTILKKLMVSDFTIGEHGVHYLIESLECNNTLEILELPSTYESSTKEIISDLDMRVKWTTI